jgi:uncharacterized membrane protein required for colicin V production
MIIRIVGIFMVLAAVAGVVKAFASILGWL